MEEMMSRMEQMMADWHRSHLDFQNTMSRQISELRASMNRSRKGKEENQEDQSLNDKQLVETEVETEPIETEDRAVIEEPIPQLQIPDSQKVDAETELPQHPVGGTIISHLSPLVPRVQFQEDLVRMADEVMEFAIDDCFRGIQLFDPGGFNCIKDSGVLLFGSHQLEAQVRGVLADSLIVGSVVVEDFQETQWLFNDELKDNQIFQSLIEEGSHRLDHQKKLSKSPKSWKFKFKISLDRWLKAPCVKLETEYFLEIESLQEDVQLERDEMLEVARDVSNRSMLGLMFGIRESNAGEDQRAVCEQIIKVNVWLYQISLVVQQVRRNKKIKFSKRWWFKYKYVEVGVKRLHNQLRYKCLLELEERFKIWSRRESWRKHKEVQQFMATKEEMEVGMKENDQKQRGDWGHYFLLLAAANWSPQMHLWSTSYRVWHRWKARWFLVRMISTMRAWLFGEEGFDIGKEMRRGHMK